MEFRPDIILVSAGFSAAAGDVGSCNVTPDGFAQLTRMLMSITPKVVLILEGGYDLTVIGDCASACFKALLGDELKWRSEVSPKPEARASFEQTLRCQRQYWPSLNDDHCINALKAATIKIE